MRQFQLLFAFIGVSLVGSEVYFGDPCYLSPYVKQIGSKQIDLEVPKNCTYGSVDWNYPSGVIHMYLTREDGPFAFCLEVSWGTMLGGLQKVINGVATDIDLPTKDTPTCIDDVLGRAEFLIRSTSNLLYMTIFDYRVVAKLEK